MTLDQESGWYDINLTFTVTSDLSLLKLFHIYDKVQYDGGYTAQNVGGNRDTHTSFYHLKLEVAEVATAWTKSSYDATLEYDSGINRDYILNRLALLDTDGIYLQNNQLLIRASGIKTGVITSQNENIKINLDTGKFFANVFDLRAAIKNKPSADSTTSIILSNTTEYSKDGDDNYFFVGVWGGGKDSYIRLANDGTLRISTSNFTLDKDGNVSITGNITAKDGKTFHLRSDNTLDYWDVENKKPKNQRTLLLKNTTTKNKNSSYFFVGEL
jgi:hypothetical protein